MKNKKGFTLAEILGTLIIIGLLLLIITPTIIGRMANTKNTAQETGNRLIYNAASQYVLQHRSDFPMGKKYCISIRELIDEGMLASPVKDVVTGKTVDDSYSILLSIYSTGNEYYEGPYEDAECTEVASIPMIDFLVEPSGTSWVKSRKVTIKYPDGSTDRKYSLDGENMQSATSSNQELYFSEPGKIIAEAKYEGTKIKSTTESKINIVNIDSIDPTLSVVGQPTCKKTVTINLKDTGGSRLKDYAVIKGTRTPNNDEWKTLDKVSEKNIKFTAEDEVDYTIYVRDNAGNENKITFKPNVRHTVVFNLNGGSPEQSNRVLINNKSYSQLGDLPNRDDITKVGYIFRGWFEDNTTFEKQIKDNTIMCVRTADDTKNLYVKWEAKKVKVTFYRNQTTADSTTKDETYTYDVNNQKFSNSWTKTGYTAVGWNTNRAAVDGDSENLAVTYNIPNTWIESIYNLHNADKSDKSVVDHTLYLIWRANVYNLSYSLNDSSGSTRASHGTNHPSQATYDAEFTVNNPSRTGYTFAGWNITGMDSNTHYYDGSTSTATSLSSRKETKYKNLHATHNSTVTFTATWNKNQYTVSYNGNGGTPSTSSNKQTFDSNYANLPTASRTGYTFAGWYTAASGGSKITTSSTFATSNDNTTLYAHWTANQYTITYNGNGNTGGSTSSTKCTYDSNCSLASNGFSKTGYTFAGWYTAASGGSKITSYSPYKTAGGTTLYAHWVDSTPPTCGSWSGESTSWTKSNRSIYVGCNDGGSGCKQSSYLVKEYTSGETKTQYISTTISDTAGNTATCGKTANVYVDKVGPTFKITDIHATSLVSQDCVGKTSGSCTVNAHFVGYWGFQASASDGGSGVNRKEYKYFHNGSGNECSNWTSSCDWSAYSATWFKTYGRAVDNVGNVSGEVYIYTNFNA